MSELKPTCCKGMSHNGWSQGKCGKPSKVEFEGQHYCGTHNPVARKAREDAKREERNAKWKARDLAQAATQAKQTELERRAACFPELLDALQDMVFAYQYEASSENPALLKARKVILQALGKPS